VGKQAIMKSFNEGPSKFNIERCSLRRHAKVRRHAESRVETTKMQRGPRRTARIHERRRPKKVGLISMAILERNGRSKKLGGRYAPKKGKR